MEILDQLAVGLGFATLAGINLYLVTFATGLAIRFHWVLLDERFADLQVLGHTPVLAVAGALLIVETFADKIPWVDSLWDGFHTIIRPIGGGLLALSAIGTTRPEYDVMIALVAGGATLMSHGLKAGTRVVVNGTPEPVSNLVVSTAEDVAVIGGLALMKTEPKLFAGLCLVFLLLCVIMLPKLFRRIGGFVWLVRQSLSGDAARALPSGLTAEQHSALLARVADPDILWSVPVLTGRNKGLPEMRSWLAGRLVAVRGHGSRSRLFFTGRGWRHTFCIELPSEGSLLIRHEPSLLGEKLSIYDSAGTFFALFRVPRGEGALHERVASALGASPKALITA